MAQQQKTNSVKHGRPDVVHTALMYTGVVCDREGEIWLTSSSKTLPEVAISF